MPQEPKPNTWARTWSKGGINQVLEENPALWGGLWDQERFVIRVSFQACTLNYSHNLLLLWTLNYACPGLCKHGKSARPGSSSVPVAKKGASGLESNERVQTYPLPSATENLPVLSSVCSLRYFPSRNHINSDYWVPSVPGCVGEAERKMGAFKTLCYFVKE